MGPCCRHTRAGCSLRLQTCRAAPRSPPRKAPQRQAPRSSAPPRWARPCRAQNSGLKSRPCCSSGPPALLQSAPTTLQSRPCGPADLRSGSSPPGHPRACATLADGAATQARARAPVRAFTVLNLGCRTNSCTGGARQPRQHRRLRKRLQGSNSGRRAPAPHTTVQVRVAGGRAPGRRAGTALTADTRTRSPTCPSSVRTSCSPCAPTAGAADTRPSTSSPGCCAHGARGGHLGTTGESGQGRTTAGVTVPAPTMCPTYGGVQDQGRYRLNFLTKNAFFFFSWYKKVERPRTPGAR